MTEKKELKTNDLIHPWLGLYYYINEKIGILRKE